MTRTRQRHRPLRGMLPALIVAVALAVPRVAPAHDEHPARGLPLAEFLLQSACLGPEGSVMPGLLPFESGCTRRAALAEGAGLPYRKHDWPAAWEAPHRPLGYQAQDSLLGRWDGRAAAVHGFDFGDTRRRFGAFDRGLGDGGNLVRAEGHALVIAMTEDASGGVQHFVSPACRAPRDAAPAEGWLLAEAPAGHDWASRVVRINIGTRADSCPAAFGHSLTRWRRLTLDLPWREASSGAMWSVRTEAVVSEHYAGSSIAGAHHLERFWLARDLGLVRWERWENPAYSRRPGIEERAALETRARRCPALEGGGPPEAQWLLVDCRTWTNFVRAMPGAPLPSMRWEP